MAAAKLRIAMCQILVGTDKAANLVSARSAVDAAAAMGAQIVTLPECFQSPYDTTQFEAYSEPIPEAGEAVDAAASPSTAMICDAARINGIHLIGGSIPERSADGKIYNTCVVAGPDGAIVLKHRKVHLFDIDIPGKMTFKESDTLSPGNTLSVFDTPFCKVGVGICYDMRFPEQAMLMREAGCKLLVYPGAFNTTTGPAHWELLQRGRAVDNQCYVATASPARNPESSYQAWGHSSVVSPWGDVVATCGHDTATVHAEIDIARVDEVRAQVPVSMQKRTDLYSLKLCVDETLS